MTDRELLTLAAKAAGIKGAWGREGYIERRAGFIPKGWRKAWDPLRESGDALDLAVQLRLSIMIDAPGAEKPVVQVSAEDGGDYCTAFAMESLATDVAAATRRAIVRAAAEIGRAA